MTVARSQQCDREHPADRLHPAVEGQRADDEEILHEPGRQDVGGGQQSEGDRQVVARAALAHVGRRQVDRDPALGKLEAGVTYGATHAVAALPYRRIGKADDGEGGQSAADINLDVDERCLDADHRG